MKSEYDLEEEEYSRTFSKDSKRQRFKKQAMEDEPGITKGSFDVGKNFSKKSSEDENRKSSIKQSGTKQSILTKSSSKKQSFTNVSSKVDSREPKEEASNIGKGDSKNLTQNDSKNLSKGDLKVDTKDAKRDSKASSKGTSKRDLGKGEGMKTWFEDQEEEGKGSTKPEEEGNEELMVYENISGDDLNIDFEEELNKFYSWLEKEPYLPKNIDEEVVITFLWESTSLEDAEQKFQNYFYARQEMKSVFRDRHPCSPNNLFKYDAVCLVPLTSGTDKKWIIFATWLAHENPDKFSMFHMIKLVFTELDILLQENQIRGKTISILIDMDGYTEEHTKKITRFAGKKLSRLFTDCFPATFNGFYIINAPTHVADYTELFGPFDFHIVEYLEDLPGFLPKRFLPADLAGEPDAPLRNTLFEPFFKRMRRCGNWLAYEEFLRSQELMLRMTTTRDEFHAESDGDKKNKEGGTGGGGKGKGKGKKSKGGKKQKKKKK